MDRFKVSLWLLVLLQAAVSAASLVVEIVAGRLLAPYVGMSLYTWTSVIAVVLAGFSLGHWIGGRLAERAGRAALTATGWALLAAALTTALAIFLLRLLAGPVLQGVDHPVWGIAILSFLVFSLPSTFAGIPAPVLAKIAVESGDRPGQALGAIFAAGAVGAIAGTLLAGFLFISWLGSSLTLALVTVIYVLAALICLQLARSRLIWALLAMAVALALAGSALALPNPCTVESRYFCLRSVDVSASPDHPARLMVIDHLAHGISSRDAPQVQFTEHAAMLAALSHIRSERPDFSTFFIGGGSYSIPRAFALKNTGARVVAEIDPEVTAMAIRDFWFDPETATILHEDARQALKTRPQRYDIIVGDAFTDVAVPAHLVTREFFELVQSRLSPGGSFLMNVIDYEGRLLALASVARTLSEVFPEIEIWTNTTPPAPGARVVFVIAAGDTTSEASRVTVPAPDQTEFGAIAPGWVSKLIAEKGTVLTDDYAPIDRLVGRPD
ncbi:fused MFS/spermidine synthase [Alisedimentitalea sp. MJ-SS2]|uniref:fused MFS/spermidine synthase n=1 Tax=Aliisedimentitalea sp. MJ-SS2 TaxID=3049795 RepID=UPI002906DF4C|nr:fused MFS/spermidine synthase [Alisedimentitalea sp. MJ-SS2]MDU8926955.1 fused MFS/spermidine synthase [Alisedimentitalea sp. MJ-SS2]